jgi:hypothetical protein
MMEEQLVQILSSAPGVPSGIHWGARPEGEPLPGVVLNVISDRSSHTQEGPDGLSMSRVQVDVYASSFGGAKSAARSIRRLLDGYGSGEIQGIFRLSERDSNEESKDGGRTYRVSQDFEIAWNFIKANSVK